MLKTLKRSTLGVSKRLGAFDVAARTPWRDARLLILGYHGISQDDEHEWDPELYMSPEHFRRRLTLLANRGYRVLPLREALRLLHAKSLPPRSVAITFDDGYANFFTHAYPLLADFGFPATVYLTTYYCENNRPVFDVACSYLLWKGRGMVIDGAGLVEKPRALDLRTPESRAEVHATMRRFAARHRLSAAEKDGRVAELASRVRVEYGALREKRLLHLMRPDEVRALSAELVDVQLHTHRHRTPLDRRRFQAEIEENRTRLAAMLPTAATGTHFCYPSGVCHPAFLPWLRDLGIESATTCETGIASSRTDPLLLPRLVDTSVLTDVEFEAWLSGAAVCLPRRRRPPPAIV